MSAENKKGTLMSTPVKTMMIAVALLLVSNAPLQARPANEGVQPRLANVLKDGDSVALSPAGTIAIWVRFVDKGLTAAETDAALAVAEKRLSQKAIIRRQHRSSSGVLVNTTDLPLSERYLSDVVATGAVPRRQSRWLNAASYNATAAQIALIADLPCVASVDLVARGVGERPPLDPEISTELQALLADSGPDKTFESWDYGASGPGLTQMNIPAVHAMGLSGRGVTVAVFDTGFELEHESLQHLDVVATWDFINNSSDVGPRPGDSIYQVSYGTASLSALAGLAPGALIGAAYNASVILAKTEDVDSETPAEEDNWIAALEWAEGLGADIVSSGLGYYTWYTFADMDGYTAAITVAAEMASARGVCVVNSVGDFRASSTWPHLLPPADGRSVIAVGSVDINDQVTWSSSPGPTADGRLKPDVMAFGYGHPVAAAWINDLYNYGYGSNYAVPLAAGVVALMLEQNRALNPSQIMDALHLTGGRSALPDNDYGWGIIDALAAVNYWSPAISHTPIKDQEGGTGAYQVSATITARTGLDDDRLYISYRVDEGAWSLIPLSGDGGDHYTGAIPPQGRSGKQIDYYLVATGADGRTSNHPADSPRVFHSFTEGADTIPPSIKHIGLPDMLKDQWPPTVVVDAQDNMGIDDVVVMLNVPGSNDLGPLSMVDMGDHYELELPVAPEAVFPGFTITYLLVATDVAQVSNFTSAGPYSFKVVNSKGSVLLVDDRNNTKGSAGAEQRGPQVATTEDKSAANLQAWLDDAGFTVETIAASAVKSSSFQGHDVVMVTSGSNFGPYAFSDLRRSMGAWVEAGGKLIIEGGETGYAAAVSPGYPDMMGKVLPITSYSGESNGSLWATVDMAESSLLNRPHVLSMPFVIDNSGGNDWGATDLVEKAPTAFVALHAGYGSTRGGVVIHDNNTCPESAQIAYLTFDINKASDTAGRALLDNIVTYLLTDEPPGSGAVSGHVRLAGLSDRAGITVRVGNTHSTTTAADGSYTLSGLWGGDYTVTVEETGHAPANRQIRINDGVEINGSDFYLIPVIEAQLTSAPSREVPDNDAAGIADTIAVTEAGSVYGVTVSCDISHYAIGQLVVTLTSPSGTSVTLQNRTGGTADDLVGSWPDNLFVDGPGQLSDFLGDSASGSWTLHVSDRQLGALGTLNNWGLNLLVKAAGVAPVSGRTPLVTRLVGNVPNPFNPRTMISFDLGEAGPVRLEIFDLRGRLVRSLLDRGLPAGQHSQIWDGRSDSGGEVASGLYFYRLVAPNQNQSKKMLLVR